MDSVHTEAVVPGKPPVVAPDISLNALQSQEDHQQAFARVFCHIVANTPDEKIMAALNSGLKEPLKAVAVVILKSGRRVPLPDWMQERDIYGKLKEIFPSKTQDVDTLKAITDQHAEKFLQSSAGAAVKTPPVSSPIPVASTTEEAPAATGPIAVLTTISPATATTVEQAPPLVANLITTVAAPVPSAELTPAELSTLEPDELLKHFMPLDSTKKAQNASGIIFRLIFADADHQAIVSALDLGLSSPGSNSATVSQLKLGHWIPRPKWMEVHNLYTKLRERFPLGPRYVGVLKAVINEHDKNCRSLRKMTAGAATEIQTAQSVPPDPSNVKAYVDWLIENKPSFAAATGHVFDIILQDTGLQRKQQGELFCMSHRRHLSSMVSGNMPVSQHWLGDTEKCDRRSILGDKKQFPNGPVYMPVLETVVARRSEFSGEKQPPAPPDPRDAANPVIQNSTEANLDKGGKEGYNVSTSAPPVAQAAETPSLPLSNPPTEGEVKAYVDWLIENKPSFAAATSHILSLILPKNEQTTRRADAKSLVCAASELSNMASGKWPVTQHWLDDARGCDRHEILRRSPAGSTYLPVLEAAVERRPEFPGEKPRPEAPRFQFKEYVRKLVEKLEDDFPTLERTVAQGGHPRLRAALPVLRRILELNRPPTNKTKALRAVRGLADAYCWSENDPDKQALQRLLNKIPDGPGGTK